MTKFLESISKNFLVYFLGQRHANIKPPVTNLYFSIMKMKDSWFSLGFVSRNKLLNSTQKKKIDTSKIFLFLLVKLPFFLKQKSICFHPLPRSHHLIGSKFRMQS